MSQKYSGSSGTNGNRPLLILHAGTPKTGTTSLQNYLYYNRKKLHGEGILYPDIQVMSEQVPKHQWMVNHLLAGEWAEFQSKIRIAASQAGAGIHTVILSTEGIYNHWWDFSDTARANLKSLGDIFTVKLLIVFRYPISFAKSLYKQVILNPKTSVNDCYGSPMSFTEILNNSWFSRRLKYHEFLNGAEECFGVDSLLPVKYEDGDTIGQMMKILGINDRNDIPEYNKNISIGNAGVEFLRILNRYPIPDGERAKCLTMIRYLDNIAGDKSDDHMVDEYCRDKILTLAGDGISMLRRRYGIEWPREDQMPPRGQMETGDEKHIKI